MVSQPNLLEDFRANHIVQGKRKKAAKKPTGPKKVGFIPSLLNLRDSVQARTNIGAERASP